MDLPAIATMASLVGMAAFLLVTGLTSPVASAQSGTEPRKPDSTVGDFYSGSLLRGKLPFSGTRPAYDDPAYDDQRVIESRPKINLKKAVGKKITLVGPIQ